MMDRFPYIPLPERPRLAWPDGKRLAVWVLPNIEHYEYRPEFVNQRNAWPRMPAPDVIGYGVRDYGNRVGVWRMLDCFARHGVKATVSLNFGVIEHYPEVWQAIRERGDDILCHGFYNTRYLWGFRSRTSAPSSATASRPMPAPPAARRCPAGSAPPSPAPSTRPIS